MAALCVTGHNGHANGRKRAGREAQWPPDYYCPTPRLFISLRCALNTRPRSNIARAHIYTTCIAFALGRVQLSLSVCRLMDETAKKGAGTESKSPSRNHRRVGIDLCLMKPVYYNQDLPDAACRPFKEHYP